MKNLKRGHIFFLAVALSFALMYVSYLPAVGILGRLLLLFSTLTHELGHGLTAMLVGGEFHKLVISWDGSGVTSWSGEGGRISPALVAAGGLVGPAIAAAVLFWFARSSDTKFLWATRFFGGGLWLAGVLTARSLWALVFTIGLGSLLVLLASYLNRKNLEAVIVFIGVQLSLSVFTRSDYLFTESAGPNLASDVAHMSKALFLPYWFWGALCGLFSLVVLFWGARCYIAKS